MTIDFIGYGGAFDVEVGNSAALVSSGDERLLIDAGYTVYPALRKANLAHQITGILLTHTHDDHIGSLGPIVMHARYVGGIDRRMPIYLPDSLMDRVQSLLQLTLGNAEKHVEWRSIDALPWVEAIDTTDLHVPGLPSCGYAFSEGSKLALYSGDLADTHLLVNRCLSRKWQPELIFHDCTFAEGNHHHAFYRNLQEHAADWPLVGYHCRPADRPSDCTLPLVGDGGVTRFVL